LIQKSNENIDIDVRGGLLHRLMAFHASVIAVLLAQQSLRVLHKQDEAIQSYNGFVF